MIMLCFSCTHKLQPAEVASMKPLSMYYDHATSFDLVEIASRWCNYQIFSEIFGEAYVQTTVNALRKCGIWQYNQYNFYDVNFIATQNNKHLLTTMHTSNFATYGSREIQTEPQSVPEND